MPSNGLLPHKWVHSKEQIPNIQRKRTTGQTTQETVVYQVDVRWGYNNIHIKEGDQWKTALKTNHGLFKYNVMFFGLCNSLATFQTLMDEAFKELIDKGTIFVYGQHSHCNRRTTLWTCKGSMESTKDPSRKRPFPQTLQMWISPENSNLLRILSQRK